MLNNLLVRILGVTSSLLEERMTMGFVDWKIKTCTKLGLTILSGEPNSVVTRYNCVLDSYLSEGQFDLAF